MNDYIKIRNALDRLIDAKKDLRKLGVLRSERTIGEYGEWFAEKMTGARRDDSTSRKGYDLLLNGSWRIQVKSHAKGDHNNARWTDWPYIEKVFDELVILVFNKELFLKEAYRMTFEQADSKLRRHLKNPELKWDDCQEFKIKQYPDNLKPFILKQ
nr:hypothetical protein [Allomuricauda sp.]